MNRIKNPVGSMAKRHNFIPAKGLFITGTDTGVGKTLTAAAIAATICKSYEKKNVQKKVGVFKPIATGCRSTRDGLVSSDAEFLSHCSQSTCTLEQINPIRYSQPLAPAVAAELSHTPIDWDAMQLAYSNVVTSSDFVLVEGVGGVYVPLEKNYFILDLIADFALPVLIVSRIGLGAINHTMLTVNACRERSLRIAGIVLNGHNPDTASLAEETNPRVIAELTATPILSILPYDPNASVEKGIMTDNILAAAAMTSWFSAIEKSM